MYVARILRSKEPISSVTELNDADLQKVCTEISKGKNLKSTDYPGRYRSRTRAFALDERGCMLWFSRVVRTGFSLMPPSIIQTGFQKGCMRVVFKGFTVFLICRRR